MLYYRWCNAVTISMFNEVSMIISFCHCFLRIDRN